MRRIEAAQASFFGRWKAACAHGSNPWEWGGVVVSQNDSPVGLVSFLVQEFDDFEIILVENACDQKNLDWLEWFSKARMARKGFLKLLHSEKPGVWPSMDLGFKEAKGDILIWSCSHIAIHRGTIPAMVNLLRAP